MQLTLKLIISIKTCLDNFGDVDHRDFPALLFLIFTFFLFNYLKDVKKAN